MTDTTKPPERVWAVRLRDGSWRLTKYHDPATVHATYTLASSLPGSVEEIEELVAKCREIRRFVVELSLARWATEDEKCVRVKQALESVRVIEALDRALAAMKKEE